MTAVILGELAGKARVRRSSKWMEALAFIGKPATPLDTASSNGLWFLWKNLHPSEDGEALRRITSRTLPTERSFTPERPCDPGPLLHWFAVYTTCRHEKRVALHFSQRSIEHFLPLYRSDRKWRDGSKVTLDLPLFPGYIFVHISRMDRVRVLNVPGTLAVVGGTGKEPAPIPDVALEALRCGLQSRKIEPHPLLTFGQRVRIRSGALAGMEGVVVRKKGGFRVVLTLQQIMQSIAVEVDEQDVEPVAAEKLMPARVDLSAPSRLALHP